MAKEAKKRSRNQQAVRGQYKVMLIEKPLVLSRPWTTSIPITTVTTTTAIPPTMSDPYDCYNFMALDFLHHIKFICFQPIQHLKNTRGPQAPNTQIMAKALEQRRHPYASSGRKTESKKIRLFTGQKPSNKRDNNLPSYTVSYR